MVRYMLWFIFAVLNVVSYFFLGHCNVNGIHYKDGDTFFKPQNPVQENNVGCRSCVCDQGNATCNHFYTCDFPLQCEKYIPAPQGLCCPTCGKATFNKASALGPVSRKSRELFGPEKPFVKLRPAYSVKLVF